MLKCPSVSEWLAQFAPEERLLAAITLENLRFVTNDELSHDLMEALREKVDSLVQMQSKVIIEALIPLEDVNRYLRAKEEKAPANSEHYPRIYEDYFPAEVRDADSGSEKIIDVLIRSEYQRAKTVFAKALQPHAVIRDRAQIEALRSAPHKVEIILVTDNIGSGKQVIDYLEKVSRCCIDGTLAACEVNVSIITWTATDLGVAAISSWIETIRAKVVSADDNEKSQPAGNLDIFRLKRTDSFHNLSDPELKKNLFQLFARYGDPKGKKTSKGLGFGQAASQTVLLGTSCPNNVPDFLYTDSGNKSYSPLFPGKRIPGDLYDYIVGRRPLQPAQNKGFGEFEELLRQQGLLTAANRREAYGDPSWVLLVLAVAGATRNEAILWSNIHYYRFRRAERRLISLGWINPDFSPTQEGERSVRTYGRKGNYADYASARRFLKRQVDARQVRYYPQALRGVR